MIGASSLAVTPRPADYVELMKPRLTLMVLATTGMGALLAGSVDPARLTLTLIGTFLAAAGASALNMVLERDADALMVRTRNRPIPAGRLSAGDALAFGAMLSAAGVVAVCLVEPLAGLLTAATVAIYLFAYTPLKRRSALATPVGAVSGALPPLIGWVAVSDLTLGAWVLFAVLFLWQLPHFLSIAWLYREDYARAGMPMLPVVEPDGASTGRQMVLNTVALILVSLAPAFWGGAGTAYLVAALALGAAFLASGAAFLWRRSRGSARAVFVASLVYLPSLLALMALGGRSNV